MWWIVFEIFWKDEGNKGHFFPVETDPDLCTFVGRCSESMESAVQLYDGWQ